MGPRGGCPSHTQQAVGGREGILASSPLNGGGRDRTWKDSYCTWYLEQGEAAFLSLPSLLFLPSLSPHFHTTSLSLPPGRHESLPSQDPGSPWGCEASPLPLPRLLPSDLALTSLPRLGAGLELSTHHGEMVGSHSWSVCLSVPSHPKIQNSTHYKGPSSQYSKHHHVV